MLISRNWLQSYFKTELPSAEKIAETLMMHSFELEGIQSINNDHIIDIDVLPNRAHDCLSYQGVAREYSVLTGNKIISNRYHNNDSLLLSENSVTIKIDDPKKCYRYIARIISNIVVEDSPLWLKERMESIGQKSINNIVDATNYVMFDIGNPMHAFDADKVVGKITVRNATESETLTILGGREVELSIDDLVIADDEGVLAIAGIKGGIKAKVTENTKNIIIEVANFNPTTTRSTSRRIKILTDSSKRFENQISSEIAPTAMESISRLISKIANAESIGRVTDMYPKKEEKHIINVHHEYINRLLGTSLQISDVEHILLKMNYQYHREDSDYAIHIPAKRLDLRIPVDIIEEIGRIYGYYNIPSKSLDEFVFEPKINQGTYIENRLKTIFIDKGLSEIKNYNFVKKGEIHLSNPLASDKSALRKNLFKEMLIALEKNSNNFDFFGVDQIAIFEIGRVYNKKHESDVCCIAIINKNKQANKKYGTERNQLESLIIKINKEFNITLKTHYEGTSVSFNIEECYQKEGSYKNLFTIASYENSSIFHTVSAFPYSRRDISFWAPEGTLENSLISIINTVNTNYLKKIFMFDRFEKEERVSYGFSLIFQSNIKTLTDEDIGDDMLLIENKLSKNNFEIR
jgi:phenylalanyl-tRNA synthetase beta chain